MLIRPARDNVKRAQIVTSDGDPFGLIASLFYAHSPKRVFVAEQGGLANERPGSVTHG